MVKKLPQKTNQFSVHLINLDPTQGSEIQKIRPCVVISPDELNNHFCTVIIAPMTTTLTEYPFRAAVKFDKKNGMIALDQIRAVDKSRLVKNLGNLAPKEAQNCINILQEMFS